MQRDELLNQLKSQNLETVAPAAFRQVGNPVFPDSGALQSLEAFGHVVEAFRHVHMIAYGQHIPATSTTAGIDGDGTLLSITGNQVAKVQFLQIDNSGPDPVTGVTVSLGGVVIALVDAGPGVSPIPIEPFTVDSNEALTVGASSGSINIKAVYHLVSQ